MSVITKGKTFANGEQLTAGKLNQMLDAATFNTAAVDNTKTTLSGGAITIAPNAISFSELSNSLVNDTDTMSDASATTLATSESIKAYIDSSRPKFVPALTTGSTALEQLITTGTGTSTFTYNIDEFDSSDTDFGGYQQIIAVHIDCYAQSRGSLQQVTVTYPNGSTAFMVAAAEYQSAIATGNQSESNTVIPINKDQSTLTIKHVRNFSGAEDDTFSKITGFTIIPTLPVS